MEGTETGDETDVLTVAGVDADDRGDVTERAGGLSGVEGERGSPSATSFSGSALARFSTATFLTSSRPAAAGVGERAAVAEGDLVAGG